METLRFAVTLLAELVPLFVLTSTVVYVFLDVLTPERIQRFLSRGSNLLQVPLAAALGALTPFCSCASVPLVNGMWQAGVPTAPLVAFLIASPLVSPVAVVLLWGLIGPEYAALYTGAALVMAATGGLAVAGWHRGHELAAVAAAIGSSVGGCGGGCDQAVGSAAADGALRMSRVAGWTGSAAVALPGLSALHLTTGRVADRVYRAARRSLSDLRNLALPIVIAVAIGAAIYGYAPSELIQKVAGPDTVWGVPGAAALSIPVYASFMILLPLASTLLAKGVGIGAVTAFLMGASGFSLPEGIMLSRILPGSLLWRVIAVFTGSVVGIGYLFQALAG